MGNFSHGGDIYCLKKKVIDFSSNINPLPVSYKLKKIISKEIEKINIYPDNSCRDLKEEISKYWEIKKENIFIGNGASELIYLFFNIFKPKDILIPVPTFSEYERCAKIFGTKTIFSSLDSNFNFKLNQTKNFDSIIFCNPNNPTGNLIISKEEILKFKNKLILLDESFMDFVEKENEKTMIYDAINEENIVVIRSFGKFWGLAGLRVGYSISNKENIEKFENNKIIWSVNLIGQIFATTLIKDKKFKEKILKFIKKEKKYLYNEISKIPSLKIFPSLTNFFLIKIEKNGIDAKFLKEKLIEEGFLIRDCSNFRGLNNKFFRISVRRHDENLKLIKSLKNILWKN
ncbi:MAG: aminotransferase class I/II-fold pyridoxal phosphate-dependent enzyme [Candidatus Omnitrophica bacterium]|nr:aminotransferase class I/II-fold pyridoxal phosphate-dependent enzyme [Candidatus Omnitrophota bacterium]MCM8802342.1 aminotransferase class I/II-fold pyridoxal phosphate-dependent enzyme [Candidatus Omnitrophota bacterium]